jgi:hypothetical protein
MNESLLYPFLALEEGVFAVDARISLQAHKDLTER